MNRDYLKSFRMDRGYTQKKLAESLGITESYYSYIERGERKNKMDLQLLIKLSSVLNKPLDELIALEIKGYQK